MPDPRPIADADRDAILAAIEKRDAGQIEVEKAVAQALLNGASIRAVAAASGLAQNTVQKYGARYGWPTAENRARFYESRWDRARRPE